MNKEELIKIYDTHKDCAVFIASEWNSKCKSTFVKLEDLFRMFEAVRERNENAVYQD